MSKPTSLVSLLAIVFVTAWSLSALLASNAAQPNWSTIERNYAAASLELARARLAQAESQKQAVVDSVSQDTLNALQANVQFSQDQLAQLTGSETARPFAAQIATAERELRGLEAEYAKSLEANRLAAGAVSELALRNEVAEINVAKARLAVMRAIGQQPAEVRMQWQINQLQEQVRALWARPLIEN